MKPKVTFRKGPTSFSLPAPVRVELSCTIEEKGVVLNPDIFDVELCSLTMEEKNTLASFFKNTANGMKGTWTYTDPEGIEFEARFDSPALVFVKFAQNSYDVSLRIELKELKPT